MKILVVGGGGREHTIAWRLSRDPNVEQIICAPGNAGISQLATCLPVSGEDIQGQLSIARKYEVDLTVVGPEAPLVAGITETFLASGFPILGPTKDGAMIEGSKIFCKDLLHKYNIPTAEFQIFHFPQMAERFVRSLIPSEFPVVLKADGLAAGKGVIIAHSESEAREAIEKIMVKKEFGAAGNRLIIEKFLKGRECSMIVLTDGENVIPFPPSRDFKRAFDDDKGLNTGGMGAYAPLPDVPAGLQQEILVAIVKPTIAAMAKENHPYRGFMYFGLILTDSGPSVLEINCRLGDPETQVQLPLLLSNFSELLFMATAAGSLRDMSIEWSSQCAVCVVLASEGYPNKYQKGFPIGGIQNAPTDSGLIFHAGTAHSGTGAIITNGGRVLNIVGLAPTVALARDQAYAMINSGIIFSGMRYRQDIAAGV